MAVSQPTIKAVLKTLYDDAKSTPMTEDEFADRMATIIADAVQSGDVVGVQSGGSTIPVT